MRSPMPSAESYFPDFITNSAESITCRVHNRLLTPRVLYSINGLTTYSREMLYTVWAQLPLFSRQVLQLVYLDFSTLFVNYALLWVVNNRYVVYQSQIPAVLSYFVASALTFFQCVLFVMVWLQKPQSWIHSSVLLLKLPGEWQRIPKEDVPKLDVSCCVSCNKLREIKGDIRSAVLYFFQQLVLSGVRLLPFGNVLSFIPHILMTGRMLAEYRYRTEGVCDRHIEKTYQQNWEFFAVLGFCHFVGVALSNILLEFSVGIPSDAFEPCFSGVIMLTLVRLTYGMKTFPRPVEQAIRAFPIPDPTRWVVESGIDFMAFKLKQSLRDPGTVSSMLDTGHQKCTQLQHLFLCLQAHYQAQIRTHPYFSKIPLSYFLPTMLRTVDHFFDDPIAGVWCLNQLNHWKDVLEKILEYRRLILVVKEKTEFINQVRQDRAVKFFLFFFGGIAGTINDIFTIDFVINRCPNYIRDFIEFMNKLKNNRLITEVWYQETVAVLHKLKLNLEVIRRVLNELPESFGVDFFNLLGDHRFRKYLILMIGSINDFLSKRHVGLEAMGYDLVEIPDSETTCHFPENLIESPHGGRSPVLLSSASATFFSVPPLPKANSMEEWDDSDRRLVRVNRSQAPLPTNSDDDWDDSDHSLVRRM